MQIISEIPSPLYVVVQWTTAILLISPICTSFHSYYNSPNTLDIVNPPELLALASVMMFVAVVVFFSISMICYAQVFFHILHYNYFTNSVNRQELRLCIQATGLLVAFVLLFFYHVGQFVINHINDLPLLFTWRLFHPLVTGFVSWVQPWMCLAFNSDVREHVQKILFCRREQLPTRTGTMRNLLGLLLVVVSVATVLGQFYGGRGPYGGGPYGGGFGRGPYGGGFGRSPYGYGGNPYGGGFGRVNPLQGAMMGAMMGAMRG
ncbi:unnamed protein product [Haemonchus placei]|uniref:G_PROTEIN_RECEP_F1_2 domain-containing protein n=1 Tax=Haemonchus placei TaxID=6290 RepID=A0A3P7YV87_HAEPC|nr:unnamed protein product [Haemonchus placei]